MISKKSSVILLVVGTLLLIVVGFLLKPIPQPDAYNDFADERSWFGVPSAANVLSNILFAVGGFWGLFLLLTPGRIPFVYERERWPWIGVSIGLILTAAGSAYYHFTPDNARLVWDRLGMVVIFTSFVSALFAERISIRFGLIVWPFLLFFGIFSVLFWYAQEVRGISDLRLYLGLQVFTVLVTLVMLLAPTPYTRRWDLLVAILLFALARVFEIYDHQTYRLTGGFVSGHTLKHVVAALAGIWLIRMIWKRKIIKGKLA